MEKKGFKNYPDSHNWYEAENMECDQFVRAWCGPLNAGIETWNNP